MKFNPMKITSWFFDFDDTLASAALTWAFDTAIPKLIEQYNLPVEQNHLERELLVAQERWSHDDNFMPILNDLFKEMGWSSELQKAFMKDLQTGYQPRVFEDALDLLRSLAQAGQLVYVISNNVIAPQTAQNLGIAPYVRDIFTPHMFPDAQRKPHPSFWQAILNRYPSLRTTTPIFIGNNPWTDGAFAEACGISCCIVDRTGRMASLYEGKPYRWVNSLRDIPLA